ncbi:MAG TPA: AAA family ATPase [Cellvibrionaceae bacterium]
MAEYEPQLNEMVKSLSQTIESIKTNNNNTSHIIDCLALGEDYINLLNDAISVIQAHPRAEKYFFQFKNIFNSSYEKVVQLLLSSQSSLWEQVDSRVLDPAKTQLKKLKSFVNFSKKLGDFGKNVVGVGANGSGKSTLAEKLKNDMDNDGVVISAQKILLIPETNSAEDPTQTAEKVKNYQTQDKTNKNPNYISTLQHEFSAILANLFAENTAANHKYRLDTIEALKENQLLSAPKPTKLDTTIELWNRLIEHRKIEIKDGINIALTDPSGGNYSATRMSDGEKVILFLIAQVLQAPSNGFIIIDEPETHLHRSISKRLWDALEAERRDCLFI